MILKNNSTKIIGIQETSILPGDTAECPKGYENNPVIKKYISDGTLTEVDVNKGKKSTSGTDTEKETSAGEGDKNLEDMSEEELIRYAAERNIDIGKASSKEGILKKIQEATKSE